MILQFVCSSRRLPFVSGSRGWSASERREDPRGTLFREELVGSTRPTVRLDSTRDRLWFRVSGSRRPCGEGGLPTHLSK